MDAIKASLGLQTHLQTAIAKREKSGIKVREKILATSAESTHASRLRDAEILEWTGCTK
jgi:hypothetical protein